LVGIPGPSDYPDKIEAQSDKISELLIQANIDGVFPGGVLVYGKPISKIYRALAVGQRGLSRHIEKVNIDQVYDLASITKVACTTVLVIMAIDRGLVSLDTPLKSFDWPVPDDLAQLTVIDLLSHQSGLPAWRPYYAYPELGNKKSLIKAIFSERPLFRPKAETLYSDLNFMLLGLMLELIWDCALDEIFNREIAQILDLKRTTFRPFGLKAAPTEDGPRLGGPLDYPLNPVLGPVPTGEVHDDNARSFGGVSGHAGLFGSAPEIWRIVCDLAASLAGQKGLLTSGLTLSKFLTPVPSREGNGRALGFDVGAGPLEGAFGHLGYTGGSLWWDPSRDRAFVFLCNRVHPTARNQKMLAFRRELALTLWP
jgi:CubicO group peptidase (beta-lactamase class C family)